MGNKKEYVAIKADWAEKIAEDYSAKDIFNFAQALRQNYFEKALYWYKVSSDLDFSKATSQLEIINLSSDYKKNKTNDLLSKLVKKIIAFCLELDEEIKIYEKIYSGAASSRT